LLDLRPCGIPVGKNKVVQGIIERERAGKLQAQKTPTNPTKTKNLRKKRQKKKTVNAQQ